MSLPRAVRDIQRNGNGTPYATVHWYETETDALVDRPFLIDQVMLPYYDQWQTEDERTAYVAAVLDARAQELLRQRELQKQPLQVPAALRRPHVTVQGRVESIAERAVRRAQTGRDPVPPQTR